MSTWSVEIEEYIFKTNMFRVFNALIDFDNFSILSHRQQLHFLDLHVQWMNNVALKCQMRNVQTVFVNANRTLSQCVETSVFHVSEYFHSIPYLVNICTIIASYGKCSEDT